MEQIEGVKEELISTPLDELKFRQGYIRALSSILQIDIEEPQ